jgi:hypothetical protein
LTADQLSRTTWESVGGNPEAVGVNVDVTSNMDDVALAKRFGLQQKNKCDQLAAYLSWLCTSSRDSTDDEIVGRTYNLHSALGSTCERNLRECFRCAVF